MADTPQHEQGKIESKSDPTGALPAVESPSISPAVTEPVAEAPKSEASPASETVSTASTPEVAPAKLFSLPRFRLTARHKRYGLLAASVAIAAAFGAVVGAVASGGFAAPARTDVARQDESKAMQQSIARLSKEIVSLKANVDAANKTAHVQVAKIAEQLNRAASEITGSIAAPQTVTPLPVSRPAQRVAAVEARPPAHPRVVQDWTIRDVYDGFVYVQGHGDIYRVSIGAPLPGLGRVEQVKRQDGRWVVQTPKGIIVSLRDRRYFE